MINNKYPTTKPSLNLDFANTKSLDPRITFRRGTPGTYYDGVTHAKAEENLIDYSEDFSVWSGTPTLLEPLAVGGVSPIGTQAYKFIADTTPSSTTYGYLPLSKSELLTSYSIHVKADGLNYAWFGTCWNGNNYVSFVVDLTTGQVLNNLTRNRDNILISTDVTDVGDGWYRVKYVTDHFTPNYMSIGGFSNPSTDLSSSGLPTFSGDGVSGILLWGAQVETRNAVTSYTATNGTPITKYQPKLMTAAADDARFDHDPITGESKGLLIEESRTNLISYSEDVGHTDWTKGSTSITSNIIVAPDGTLTGDKLVDSATDSVHNTSQTLALQAGVHTFSVYAKKAELKYMIMYDDTNVGLIVFNLENGTAPITAGSFTDYSISDVGNGWYKCVLVTSSFSAGSHKFMIYTNTTESGSSQHVGDGYSGFYIWGAQVEAGSFATSYIKTTGASATRSADNASITGENFSSWYRQDEGSIYLEASTFSDFNGESRVMFSDGTYDNRFMLTNYGDNFMFTTANGVNQASFTGPTILNKFIKKAAAFKEDDFAGSIQDFNDFTDTNAKMPIAIDRVHFHNVVANESYLNGHIKKLAYYPQRLTNEQLQNLTK